MLKAEARKIYREKRMVLKETERAKMDDLLLIQFQQIPLPFLQCMLAYWPMEKNKEVNTHLVADYLAFSNPGMRMAYPRTNIAALTMEAVEVNEETEFVQNAYHIFEPVGGEVMDPAEPDLVLVPQLICDLQGYRAGYGKGFYDRYLAGCRKDCIKIGFSYFEPVDRLDDRNEFDIPLNYCVTPQRIYVF